MWLALSSPRPPGSQRRNRDLKGCNEQAASHRFLFFKKNLLRHFVFVRAEDQLFFAFAERNQVIYSLLRHNMVYHAVSFVLHLDVCTIVDLKHWKKRGDFGDI